MCFSSSEMTAVGSFMQQEGILRTKEKEYKETHSIFRSGNVYRK
jgi:hypothetical protein